MGCEASSPHPQDNRRADDDAARDPQVPVSGGDKHPHNDQSTKASAAPSSSMPLGASGSSSKSLRGLGSGAPPPRKSRKDRRARAPAGVQYKYVDVDGNSTDGDSDTGSIGRDIVTRAASDSGRLAREPDQVVLLRRLDKQRKSMKARNPALADPGKIQAAPLLKEQILRIFPRHDYERVQTWVDSIAEYAIVSPQPEAGASGSRLQSKHSSGITLLNSEMAAGAARETPGDPDAMPGWL